MTRLKALINLRDAVKAGDWLHSSVVVNSPLVKWGSLIHAACAGSLDAAKALHEAVLPGWAWTVGDNEVAIYVPNDGWTGEVDHFVEVVFQNTPARAWLLAILEALISTDDPDDQLADH